MAKETIRSEGVDKEGENQQRAPRSITGIFDRLRQGLAVPSKPDTQRLVDLHHQQMVASMQGMGVTLL